MATKRRLTLTIRSIETLCAATSSKLDWMYYTVMTKSCEDLTKLYSDLNEVSTWVGHIRTEIGRARAEIAALETTIVRGAPDKYIRSTSAIVDRAERVELAQIEDTLDTIGTFATVNLLNNSEWRLDSTTSASE